MLTPNVFGGFHCSEVYNIDTGVTERVTTDKHFAPDESDVSIRGHD